MWLQEEQQADRTAGRGGLTSGGWEGQVTHRASEFVAGQRCPVRQSKSPGRHPFFSVQNSTDHSAGAYRSRQQHAPEPTHQWGATLPVS
jgi:hypothetical protein